MANKLLDDVFMQAMKQQCHALPTSMQTHRIVSSVYVRYAALMRYIRPACRPSLLHDTSRVLGVLLTPGYRTQTRWCWLLSSER